MEQTDNYELPYPQCDPPLVEDAADIAHLRDLAEAVDAVVTDIDDQVMSVLSHPDAVRMLSATDVPGTGSVNGTTITVNYSLLSFDNTPGQLMSDTASGVVRIQEDGWYLIGHWVESRSDPVPDGSPRVRFLVNGAAASGWSHRGRSTQGYVQAFEVFRLSAQDSVTSQISMATSVSNLVYTAHIWALQLMVV